MRPPRLGGNRRVGVFATRSPFRPNALGLSCVRLTATEQLTVPVDTVHDDLPAIRNPLDAVTLFAERSTALASSSESVPTEERSGPFTTAYTVFAPEVADTDPVSSLPKSR